MGLLRWAFYENSCKLKALTAFLDVAFCQTNS